MPKSIFISYAEADRSLATDLHEALLSLIGQDSWVRDIHLDGGDIIVEALNDAASEAKFFLILVSAAALKSDYIRTEANYASFRAIEDLGVRIVVIRLDTTPLPPHLEVALGSKFMMDLSQTQEPRSAFIDIAEYIEKHIHPPQSNGVYVDRGEPTDEFSLIARRNKLVFVLGPNGIGKTSFVVQSVSQRISKRPILVKLSRGHSLDIICRQIIKAGHILQPEKGASDADLLAMAIKTLATRSDRFFLFLDNAEEALDAFNAPLGHIVGLANAFIDADIDTHILFATTRTPDIPIGLTAYTDVLVLRGLDDRFVREEIELLLNDETKIKELNESASYGELVHLAAGYPLAAKLLGSLLKTRTPSQLVQKDEWRKFELKLALHRGCRSNCVNDLF